MNVLNRLPPWSSLGEQFLRFSKNDLSWFNRILLLFQGSYRSWKTWKVMEFGLVFFQALKVMENWYFYKKVMESHGMTKFMEVYVFSVVRCVNNKIISYFHFFVSVFSFWNASHGILTSKVMESHWILFGKKCMNPVFERRKSCVFQIFLLLLRSIKACFCPNIINFDSVNFSECRPEEVISFFWRSVY